MDFTPLLPNSLEWRPSKKMDDAVFLCKAADKNSDLPAAGNRKA
jgi:hypothetical protein